MRILLPIALLLIALVAGGLAALPRLVTWDDYRDELTAKAEAITGQTVAIEGRIDLSLLPQPTLTLAQTTLASPSATADRVRLRVDRLDLELNPLPLLGGRLDVEEVRLVRPVLQLEPAADHRPELLQLAGAVAWLPLRPGGPSRVRVVDGRAVLPEFGLGRVAQLEQVNLDFATTEPTGAVALAGTFALNSQPFRIDARFGRLTEETSSTLRLELVADGVADSASSTLTFGGVVWWRPEAPRLRGELAVGGEDARSAVGTLGKALGQPIVPLPAWLAAPFRLTGRVELEDNSLGLSELALGVDDTELNGHLRVILAEVPQIDLQVEMAELEIPADAADLYGGLAPLVALTPWLRGDVDLAIGAVDYRGDTVRRFRAALRLPGDGHVAIADARAILPGQTDVSFTGEFAGTGDDAELRGRLDAVTENPRAALAWLDLNPDQIADGRLSSLTLASELTVRRDALRFAELELRVDASRITGSVAVNPTPRPQVAADLALDRFDLDAYWPGHAPAELLAQLAGPLLAFDAAIEARLQRLTWRGVHLLDLGFSGRAVDGHLTINELTVGDLAEAEARLTGGVELADGAFDLSAELRGVQAARLLRRLGFEPAPLLTRLRPLTIEGLATGSLEAARIELELSDGSGRVSLAGDTGWDGDRPQYQFDLEAAHPDYRELARDLGAPLQPGGGSAAPLSVAGKVQRSPGGALSVAGTARLGETSFTGKVAWQRDGARPKIAARISAGEPTAAVLGGLLHLSGLRLEWPAFGGGFPGSWSEEPLALHLLDRFDGELALSSKGGLAGQGLELVARFERGRLAIDRVSMALWDGRLEGQLSFDVRRRLPYLVASVDLKAFDPTALAAWLGVAPVVAGPADLHLEATGAGSNARALVGSLIGQIDLAAAGGIVVAQGLPASLAIPARPPAAAPASEPSSLAARFPLERGVVIAHALDLKVGGIRMRLEGTIDLYLWATDLTLRPQTDGQVLKIVGPLHRPQVRLIEAAGRERAAPGPSASP